MLTVNSDRTCHKNLYAYCDNNPITREDLGGQFWTIVAGAVIGAVISAATEVVSQVIVDHKVNLENVVVAAVGGAVSGAFAATGVGLYGQMAINAAIGGATETYNQIRTKGFENPVSAVVNIAGATVAGAAAGAIGGEGIKAKGTSYRNLIDTKSFVNATAVERVIADPNAARYMTNMWIKQSVAEIPKAVRKTTVSFTKAAVASVLMSRFRQVMINL